MTEVVLDASVFVAAISPNEIHHMAAAALYRSHPQDLPFWVPGLFRVEVLSALARRKEPDALLDTVDVLVTGPRFHSVAIDAALIARAAQVARIARVRAYDAIYVALALDHGATLFTLDRDIGERVRALYPELKFA
ncbi:MAG: type II toxin-antitoxin system VapC family toxin [Myxococcales bacterium]